MKNQGRHYIFRLITTAYFAIVFCLNVSAQASADCDKLLRKEITADPLHVLISNIMQANCFGLDSIDRKVFSNGPVLGTILVKLISTNNGKVTYAELLTQINKVKRDTGYLSLRKVIIAQDALESVIASPKTWESNKGFLMMTGMGKDEVENLYQFMLQNQDKNWNYRQLVINYKEKAAETSRDRRSDTSNINDLKTLKTLYSKYCDTGRLTKIGENLVAFNDYLYGLECAKKMHKSSLIFFNARYSVNSRRLESLITYDPQINSYLKKNYVIIKLMVDDNTLLPNSQKTIGEINGDLERKKFKVNYQPFIVIIDEHNNIKGRTGSTSDSNTFLNFLRKQD